MTPVTYSSRRAYLWQLINEFAQNEALLHILDMDIEVRRKLEELQRTPFGERRSVTVEQARADTQEAQVRLKAEIDAAIEILGRGNQ